jgi:hypothetical protein
MNQRRIWLADHRGRNAVVVLVPRHRAAHAGHRRDGNEIQRRPPELVPANLVPDRAPVWSGKLLSCQDAIARFAFTRAYQVRHGNALEYDFLFGLAAHLEQRESLVLVGSGPRGIGPLIPERNALPMKGFLAGKTQDWRCSTLAATIPGSLRGRARPPIGIVALNGVAAAIAPATSTLPLFSRVAACHSLVVVMSLVAVNVPALAS